MTRRPKGSASGVSAQCAPARARRSALTSAAAIMAASTTPIDGVVPPTATLSHSSARSAPAWAETRTPSMFSTQVSTTTWSGARQGAGEGWRKGSILGSLVAFMGELCHA